MQGLGMRLGKGRGNLSYRLEREAITAYLAEQAQRQEGEGRGKKMDFGDK